MVARRPVDDPYLYPGALTLKNKLGLTDAGVLSVAEGETFMRLVRLGLLALPLLVAGCGHSGSGTPTLSVTCNGNLALAGAATVTVTSAPGGSAAALSFPDPVNAGQTGSLPIPPGQACTVAPTAPSPAKSGA